MINIPKKKPKCDINEGIDTCLKLQQAVLEELQINGVKLVRELKEIIDKSPKL